MDETEIGLQTIIWVAYVIFRLPSLPVYLRLCISWLVCASPRVMYSFRSRQPSGHYWQMTSHTQCDRQWRSTLYSNNRGCDFWSKCGDFAIKNTSVTKNSKLFSLRSQKPSCAGWTCSELRNKFGDLFTMPFNSGGTRYIPKSVLAETAWKLYVTRVMVSIRI